MEGDLRIDAAGAWKRKVGFSFDGEALTASEGETLAAALHAQGRRTLRFHRDDGGPRGAFGKEALVLRAAAAFEQARPVARVDEPRG